jgi:hypothetical protein
MFEIKKVAVIFSKRMSVGFDRSLITAAVTNSIVQFTTSCNTSTYAMRVTHARTHARTHVILRASCLNNN